MDDLSDILLGPKWFSRVESGFWQVEIRKLHLIRLSTTIIIVYKFVYEQKNGLIGSPTSQLFRIKKKKNLPGLMFRLAD